MTLTTSDTGHHVAAGTRRAGLVRIRVPRLPLWLCVVQAILAYEWLVSGLDKLLDRGFGAQLSALLSQSTHGNGGSLYGVIIAHLVLPNHTLFALLTPWTETSIGAMLVLAPLREAGKAAIPPKRNRTVQREYDAALYEASHLIEHCFCERKRFRAIATRSPCSTTPSSRRIALPCARLSSTPSTVWGSS